MMNATRTHHLAAWLLALAPLAAQAQALTNAGATLTVQAGAVLYVAGGLTNAAGPFQNDGTVQLTGDFTNAGSLAGAGLLRLSGSQDQQLAPGAGASLGRVEVASTGAAGQNRVLLRTDLTVATNLLLTSGLLRTDPGATLSLPDGATLSGEASGRYVQGNLRITRASVAGPVDFGHGAVLDGSGQSLGAVSITRTAGLQTADLSYGQGLGGATKSIDRLYTIVPASPPTAPVPLTLSWLPDDDNGLSNFGAAQLWRQAAAGQPWATAGAPGDASARRLTASVPVLAGRFTVSNAENPLPVTLVAFTAERQGLAALLRWTTASELRSDYFAVESSTDGRQFQALGRVAGHGTSTQAHAYQFTDPSLNRYGAGLVYYRLRQVDQDGTATYSPVRTVQVPLADLLVEAYPTPLATGAALSLRIRSATSGPATLRVLDALGRIVAQRNLSLASGLPNGLVLPEAGQWPQGTYLLRLEAGEQQQTLKVVRE